MTPTLVEKAEWLAHFKRAVDTGTGYAAGKIGISEQHWLMYPILKAPPLAPRQLQAFETAVAFHCRSSGIFPPDPALYAVGRCLVPRSNV